MLEADPELLITSNHVVKFTIKHMFQSSLQSDHLLKNLLEISKEYKDNVVKALRICIQKFAAGFLKQKGAIFGFGDNLAENMVNDTVLQVHSFEDIGDLDKGPVHNLGEERSVGLLNYELGMRGRHYLTRHRKI